MLDGRKNVLGGLFNNFRLWLFIWFFSVPGNGEKPDEQPKTEVVEQTSQHVFPTIQHLFSTSVSWVRIRRQRDTNEFLIVSSVNILMSKSGSSPGDLSTAKPRGWLDQLR